MRMLRRASLSHLDGQQRAWHEIAGNASQLRQRKYLFLLYFYKTVLPRITLAVSGYFNARAGSPARPLKFWPEISAAL